jgi:hypothetical protein
MLPGPKVSFSAKACVSRLKIIQLQNDHPFLRWIEIINIALTFALTLNATSDTFIRKSPASNWIFSIFVVDRSLGEDRPRTAMAVIKNQREKNFDKNEAKTHRKAKKCHGLFKVHTWTIRRDPES